MLDGLYFCVAFVQHTPLHGCNGDIGAVASALV